MKRLRLVAALAVLLGGISAAPSSRAADPEATTPHPKRIVRLIVAGTDTEAASLESSLSELVARIGGSVSARRVERIDTEDNATLGVPAADAFATAWVNLKSPQRATCVLVEGKSGRIVSRRSVARGRSSDIVVEELAHIIQASVEDMAGEEAHAAAIAAPPPAPPPVATQPPPPPPPAPVPTATVAPPPGSAAALPSASVPSPDRAPDERPKTYGLNTGAFFVGRSFGSDSNVTVGGGAEIDLRLGRGQLRPALSLAGAYHVPFDASGTLVRVHASALVTRLAATIQYRASNRLVFEIGPEAGTDIFWVQPVAVNVPTQRLSGSSTDASPILGGLVAAHLAIARGSDMFLAFMTDVDLAPHRYVVHDGQDLTEVVYQPARVRPALALGFTFTVAGTAHDPDAPP